MNSKQAKRILIAWTRYTVNGGISRFIHCARILEGFGHEVQFVSLTGDCDTEWGFLSGRVLTLSQVSSESWDAVMIPGAGLPPEQLPLLNALTRENFGTRVQHILNDRSVEPRCIDINQIFKPHIVVFNNSHWGSAVNLSADTFHVLPGGVDTQLHRPAPFKQFPRDPSRWRIGAFGRKNPEPLLEAIRILPDNFHVHLYGVSECTGEAATQLAAEGRLSCWGPLYDEALAAFYDAMDLVVTTETHAGWCNTAAQAMAHGLPCIVSPAGTVDFTDGDNALTLESLDPQAIALALLRLTCDPATARRLGRNAAQSMQRFSWLDYCQSLLQLTERPQWTHYFREPSLGLWGKRDLGPRLAGLEELRTAVRGQTVLDVGAGEGLIALHFAKEFGAARVDGFERDQARVAFANELFVRLRIDTAQLHQADLSSWNGFLAAAGHLMEETYSGVLFLGLYHHLPPETRKEVLLQLCNRARNWIAVRTPTDFFVDEGIEDMVRNAGFTPVQRIEQHEVNEAGTLCVFTRSAQAA